MPDVPLTKVSETETKITFSYPHVPGVEGWRYLVNNVPVSRTFNPDDHEVTFGKVTNGIYRVVPLDVVERPDGFVWPAPAPPTGWTPPSYADFSDDFDPAPSSRWTWVFGSNGNTGFPSQGASLVDDGQGGKAVRLRSPVVGGNGQLASFYDGSGQWGTNGTHQMGEVGFRPISLNAFMWFWEWHENIGAGINSCAIGINSNRTIRIQVSGGNVSGHQYTTLNDSQVLSLNQWDTLAWDIVWSPSSSGRFKVWLGSRVLCDLSRPTLLTSGGQVDTTVIGGYSYIPGGTGEHVVDFRRFAVGAV